MDSLVDTMSKHNKSPDSKQCCFCGLSEDNELEFGKIYKHGDIVTHYYCLLLSSNMEQKGTDSEGILGFLAFDIQKELRRGKRLVCTYCKKNGATLGCCNTKCKRIFHYPCGLRAGTLNQFFGEFRSFCKYHRPKQKIDPQVTNELAKTSEVKCYICYDSVNSSDTINTIWAPCCKKNAWFHRKCVQQLAVSAGYFFKCPLCNDKKTFQEAMLEFGIFIPSQDASWELEPNAFHELLHRHDQCDAPICLCPKGRKYTSFNAKWELALCRTCGSQGIHMACGQLKWANPVWDCSECISILGKSTETTNSNTTGSMLQQINADSEDSDSDISVGKESPPPFISNVSVPTSALHTSTVKQRPGPRTFKVKQQLKAAREMQIQMQLNNSSKQGTSIGILDSTHIEESTSTNKNAKMKFDLLLEEEITKSLSAPSSDNVIILDSDDDVVEVINNSSLKNTLVTPNINETETKNLSQSRNEVSEMNTIRNYDLQTIGKLIQINDNFLTNDSNVIKSILSNENSLQNEVISDSLKETIHPNKESEYKCVDIFPDIKITNVISLTPEEFEKVPCTVEEQKDNNVECLKSQYSNELLSSKPIFQSLLAQSGCSMSNLKRKFDDTFDSTATLEDKSKKTRRNLNTHKQEQQSDSFITLQTANRSITPVNNVSTSTFAKNCVQINNNNKYETSANIPNIKSSDQLHIQVKHTCVTNNYALNKHESNAEHSVVEKCILYDVSGASTISSEYKKEDKNIAIEGYTTNCDGDAGTRPAAKSGYQKFANATRIDPTEEFIKLDHIHSPSDKSDESDKWRSQNDTEMATISMHRTPNAMSNDLSYERRNGKTECNYNRLIPEYIRLRDLKFRVYNPNNLQMTLYDKFSVNINMESATNTKKNMKLDASTRKAVQQKVFKMQSETSSNFRSGDVSHSISSAYNKDKTKYNVIINDQSESFRDDAKENLDPVITIPCKSITDNLVTSTTAVANNLPVSTNSNNRIEDENSTHFVHNASKVIEEDNKWRNRENLVNNINIVNNAENTIDVEERINVTPCATIHSNEKHFRNISDMMQNIHNLNSDHVTSSIVEKRSVKAGIRNDSVESTKLVQRALYFDDRVNSKTKNKTKSMIETCFKISIDLEKIENFIDDNPDMFFIYKKKDDERCFEKIDYLKERTDSTERINISTKHITLPKNKVAELKNQINEDNAKTEDVICTENLAQEPRYIKNFSCNNQKRDLQHTINHFEKQCIFNR